MAVNTDPGIQMILDNVQVVVASEGGNLEFVDLRDGRLTVKYNKGVNEECPECVPTLDMVRQFLTASIGIHAPHITDIEVS